MLFKKNKIYCGARRAAGGTRIKTAVLKGSKGRRNEHTTTKKGNVFHEGEPLAEIQLSSPSIKLAVSELRAGGAALSRGHSSPRNLHFPAPVYLLSGIFGADFST